MILSLNVEIFWRKISAHFRFSLVQCCFNVHGANAMVTMHARDSCDLIAITERECNMR